MVMWRMLKSRRVQVGVLVVAALVAIAVWPRAVDVDVALVARGPLVITVDEEGETRVRDKFVITAPVAGEVQRIELEPGDPVTRGRTVLARIRSASPSPLDARVRGEIESAIRAAEAVAARARADRDRLAGAAALAEQRRDRARLLLAGGAVAQEELDVREADARAAADALRAAGFLVAQAEQEVHTARARLAPAAANRPQADIVVIAPLTGVVLKRHLESAQVVSPGTPLVEIGDPQRLEVVTDLLSADAVKVPAGAEVLLEQWGGSQPLTGRVRRVEPSGFTKVSALGVEEQRVNVLIDLDDREEAVALGDAYRTEVRIVVWRGADVVRVPTGALFRRGDGWAVFVVERGRARERPVRLGQRSGREAQVLDGLTAGDQVVLYPPDTLEDGAKVVPRRPGAWTAYPRGGSIWARLRIV
jgi:HlyD family secretion protein